MQIDYLIVGAGNTLRSDDGAGWILAERLHAALAARGASVQLRLVQQLLPELAAEIAELAPAVLVVADCATVASSPPLQKLDCALPGVAHSHGLTPAQLLALAARLYEFSGNTWLATVPGANFAHGEGLSAPAQQALERTLPQMVAELVLDRQAAPARD